jgi:alpha-L-arabinofuranosidase
VPHATRIGEASLGERAVTADRRRLRSQREHDDRWREHRQPERQQRRTVISVATLDAPNGQACVLMLNRDLDAERELVLEWRDARPMRVLVCETLTGTDLKAFNTFEQPRRVAPQRLDPAAAGARMTFKLPPRSYTVAQLATT